VEVRRYTCLNKHKMNPIVSSTKTIKSIIIRPSIINASNILSHQLACLEIICCESSRGSRDCVK
jgi:hypothetical protein